MSRSQFISLSVPNFTRYSSAAGLRKCLIVPTHTRARTTENSTLVRRQSAECGGADAALTHWTLSGIHFPHTNPQSKTKVRLKDQRRTWAEGLTHVCRRSNMLLKLMSDDFTTMTSKADANQSLRSREKSESAT